MSALISQVKSRLAKFSGFADAGRDAGIEFLQVGGMLYHRLGVLGNMDDDELIAWGASFTESTLAWLNIGENTDRFTRCVAFLDFHSYYLETIDFNLPYKYPRLQGKIKCKNCFEPLSLGSGVWLCTECGEPFAEWIKTLNLSHVEGHPEVEEEIKKLRRIAISLVKILLGMSFKDPDDLKSFILNKNNIVDISGKVRYIETGGGAGAGSPEEIPNDPAEV